SIYLSDDATFDPDTDIDLADQLEGTQAPLAAGAAASGSLAVSIPVDATPGAHDLLFVADAYGHLPDPDRSNNVMVGPIPLAPPDVDLVVSSASAPAAGTVGGPISMTWTVTNQGSDPATAAWYDAVYLSDSPTLDASSQYLGAVAIGSDSPLAGRASY